jgi:H+/Cl- antiporter ClcA
MNKKAQIAAVIIILVIAAAGYSLSAKYTSGQYEIKWFHDSVNTNWNLRFFLVLSAIGGSVGLLVSRIVRKIKKS